MRPNVGSYRDVPEFIYGITQEIWESRGIGGKLDRYYAPDIILRAPTGLTTSNMGVTAQTLQTLHQFPDRQLVGEDVIWDDGGDGSFLSSHRLISVMRHQEDGNYGPASHRMVRSRIIADCWVVNTVVTEEWLVRDQAAFARCIGRTPCDLARSMVDDDLRRGQPVGYFLPEHDKNGLYAPKIADDADVARIIVGYARIWGTKETEVVRDLYFHGANLHAPGGETFCGHLDIDRFLLGYLASFPDAEFSVQSAFVNRDVGRPTRIALRWAWRGTHAGFGHFGPPTEAPVFIMGMSHVTLFDGKIAFEWLLADEVSVWKQIIAHGESKAGS